MMTTTTTMMTTTYHRVVTGVSAVSALLFSLEMFLPAVGVPFPPLMSRQMPPLSTFGLPGSTERMLLGAYLLGASLSAALACAHATSRPIVTAWAVQVTKL